MNSNPLRMGFLWLLAASVALSAFAFADDDKPTPRDTSRGDKMIADYFRAETRKLAGACLDDINTLEDWTAKRAEYNRELREMLGLDPLPEKTPLEPVITGKVDHDDFVVEKVQFQSRPGLYVTGNLYVPKNRQLDEKLPAILYVCGHGRVVKNGIAYGNKTHYQHHGGWFARNGYVCLTIDTIQLGELEGIHHGTFREKMWWWNSRGYTPAGVEAWNCVRALDYLQSRPEVDGERLGVTGRSGGGAYSWWIAALDERIKTAVPVAGITDLENHVIDGCVEGHCDCMFMVNTYRWDYAKVAALVAPRPLLISNTDKDGIFPLEGVVRVHAKVRKIYDLYGAGDKLGLQITEGPHKDTQELRVHAFRWFNRFLKNKDDLIETVAVKFFEPEQLKVFETLPSNERTTKIHESFTEIAPAPKVPESVEAWDGERERLLSALKAKSFRGWPEKPVDLDVKEAFSAEKDGVRFAAYDFTSQDGIQLRVYLAHRAGLAPKDLELLVLTAVDEEGWTKFAAAIRPGFEAQLKGEPLPEGNQDAYTQSQKMFANFKWGMACIAPRGVGPTAWDQSEKKQTQNRRRFMLLGQTLAGMQTYDVVRAAEALRKVDGLDAVPLWLQGERDMSVVALYASLFTPKIARLDLWGLPTTHQEGPDYLNVMRILDIPQAVALAAQNSQVRIYEPESDEGFEYPQQVAEKLGWKPKQIGVVVVKPEGAEKE